MFLSLIKHTLKCNFIKIYHRERIPKNTLNCRFLSPSTKTFEKGLRVAGTVLYMLYMNIWQHGKFAFMWQKRIISFFKIIPDFILVQQCYLQWRIVWFMRPWIHGEYLQKKNPTDCCVAPTISKSFDLTIIIEKSSKPAVNFEVIEPDSKIDDWERVNFKNHWSQ